MKKFEYCLLNPDKSFFTGIDYEELTQRLNHLGRQGWEVVSTVGITAGMGGQMTGLLITLKRELPG